MKKLQYALLARDEIYEIDRRKDLHQVFGEDSVDHHPIFILTDMPPHTPGLYEGQNCLHRSVLDFQSPLCSNGSLTPYRAADVIRERQLSAIDSSGLLRGVTVEVPQTRGFPWDSYDRKVFDQNRWLGFTERYGSRHALSHVRVVALAEYQGLVERIAEALYMQPVRVNGHERTTLPSSHP